MAVLGLAPKELADGTANLYMCVYRKFAVLLPSVFPRDSSISFFRFLFLIIEMRAWRCCVLLPAAGFDPWGVDRGVSADGGARGQKGSIWGVLYYALLAR